MILLPRRTYPSVDALLAAANGWQTEFKLLSRGVGQEILFQAIDTDIAISEVSLGANILQQGQAPGTFRTFAVLASDCPKIIWCGNEVDQNTLIIKPRSDQFDAVSFADFHVYTVSISEACLAQAVAESDDLELDSLLCLTGGILKIHPVRMHALRSLLEGICRRWQTSEPGMHGIRESATEIILEAIRPASPSPELNNRSSRRYIVERLLEYAHAECDSVPIIEVARSLRVSQRTLQYAVQDYFGITPKQLLTRIRLNRVRQKLKDSCKADRSVTEIANASGFTHSGQFSQDYKALFGEMPRQTLARAQ